MDGIGCVVEGGWRRARGGGRKEGIVETKVILHEVCHEDIENVVI